MQFPVIHLGLQMPHHGLLLHLLDIGLDLLLRGVGEPERATTDNDEQKEDGDEQDAGAASVDFPAGAPAHADGQA